jgi:hypothetical protein
MNAERNLPLRERVLLRATRRYGMLDHDLLSQIAETAMTFSAERPLPDQLEQALVANATVARLAGSHLARLDPEGLSTAGELAAPGNPADVALGEHLYGVLDYEELLFAALSAARKLTQGHTARLLNLEAIEIRRLEETARAKAAELTLAYYDEQICEPAALARADRPAARTEAVREHLERCSRCRREFDKRAWAVLAESGRMVAPIPPLHDALGVGVTPRPERRARPARRPAPAQAAR